MRFIPFLCVCMLCAVSIAGCAGKISSPDDGSGVVSQGNDPVNQGYYYEFDDILVPQEIELQADSSFLLETPTTKAGVLVFEGKVERISLTNFFINNMPKDNWTMTSAIKGMRTILIFEKPMRYGIINITDSTYTTRVEIWVSPRESGPRPMRTLEPEAEPTKDSLQPPEAEPDFQIAPPVQEQGLSN